MKDHLLGFPPILVMFDAEPRASHVTPPRHRPELRSGFEVRSAEFNRGIDRLGYKHRITEADCRQIKSKGAATAPHCESVRVMQETTASPEVAPTNTAEADADGWIKWEPKAGARCPVDGETPIEVLWKGVPQSSCLFCAPHLWMELPERWRHRLSRFQAYLTSGAPHA